MKKVLLPIVAAILLTLGSDSAYALFGSECREPKQSLKTTDVAEAKIELNQ